MALVRLFKTGGNPKDDVIEDLEMPVVPLIGDTFVLNYPPATAVHYSVVGRLFIVHFSVSSGQNSEPMVALEVEEMDPNADVQAMIA